MMNSKLFLFSLFIVLIVSGCSESNMNGEIHELQVKLMEYEQDPGIDCDFKEGKFSDIIKESFNKSQDYKEIYEKFEMDGKVRVAILLSNGTTNAEHNYIENYYSDELDNLILYSCGGIDGLITKKGFERMKDDKNIVRIYSPEAKGTDMKIFRPDSLCESDKECVEIGTPTDCINSDFKLKLQVHLFNQNVPNCVCKDKVCIDEREISPSWIVENEFVILENGSERKIVIFNKSISEETKFRGNLYIDYEVIKKMEKDEEIEVILTLNAEDSDVFSTQFDEIKYRKEAERIQNRFLDSVDSGTIKSTRKKFLRPLISGTITLDALNELKYNPYVVMITYNRPIRAFSSQEGVDLNILKSSINE